MKHSICFIMVASCLLVIDVQNDFCPGGRLAVEHGDQIVPMVNAVMADYKTIVLTQDWHPAGHLSLASNHAGAEPFRVATQRHQARSGPQGCVVIGILDGVADFVGRDRDRRQRAAFEVAAHQAHGLVPRVVVVALFGFLDPDPLEPEPVQQVARQLAAGAGEVRTVVAVPAQNGARPEAGTEDHGEHGDADDCVDHGREYSRSAWAKGKGRRPAARPSTLRSCWRLWPIIPLLLRACAAPDT